MLIKPFTSTDEPDKAFPKSDTCFFNFMLPEYSTKEILREKLLCDIYGCGFNECRCTHK